MSSTWRCLHCFLSGLQNLSFVTWRKPKFFKKSKRKRLRKMIWADFLANDLLDPVPGRCHWIRPFWCLFQNLTCALKDVKVFNFFLGVGVFYLFVNSCIVAITSSNGFRWLRLYRLCGCWTKVGLPTCSSKLLTLILSTKMKDITSLSNCRVFKSVYSCMFSQQLMQFLFFILLVPFLMQFLTTPLFSKQRFHRHEKLSGEA